MKSFRLFFLFLMVNTIAFCQIIKTETNNDLFRLVISPTVPSDIDIPTNSVSTIKNRLGSIIAKNGISNDDYSQFQLVANPIVITKKVVPNAPVFILNEIDLNLYLVDVFNKNIIETTNLVIKGTGNSENEAYINAFRTISVTNPEIQKLLDKGKAKIVEYYSKNCSILIKKATILEETDRMEEAIELLSQIPEVCEDCFNLAIDEIRKIHQKNISLSCSQIVNKAKTIWFTNPTLLGATESGKYLMLIPRSEKCYSDVETLLSNITAKLTANEVRDWEFQMKKYSNEVELEKLYIQAQKEIGTAFGNHQPQTITQFKGWLY